MLTFEQLKQIPEGEIFAEGVVINAPSGIFMSTSRIDGRLLWLAKKGHGHHDWAIYIHWEDMGREYVSREHGDKVMDKANILKLVPCDGKTLDRYRF